MNSMRIGIIGMGLIGGSLSMALKEQYGEKIWIAAIDSNSDTVSQAVQRKIADYGTVDPVLGVTDVDIIFICTPVLQIIPLIKKIVPHLKPGTIISDTGSTKKLLVQQMEELLPEYIYYVGGHPMAGREKSGISAADKNLFKDKRYILVENSRSIPLAVDKVCFLLAATGARINVMNADSHDTCAAVISHVPHVAAAALVNLLNYYPQPDNLLKLSGGGFKDTTRIASSNADMWADICMTNGDAIIESLNNLQKIINETISAIRDKDRQKVHAFFGQAKIRRDALLEKASSNEM